MLAKVLIVASAAAVDADIVVELIVDDAVAAADDDETAIKKQRRTKKKAAHHIMEIYKFQSLLVMGQQMTSVALHKCANSTWWKLWIGFVLCVYFFSLT